MDHMLISGTEPSKYFLKRQPAASLHTCLNSIMSFWFCNTLVLSKYLDLFASAKVGCYSTSDYCHVKSRFDQKLKNNAFQSNYLKTKECWRIDHL